MIFGTVPSIEAEGALLAHSLRVGTAQWRKGRRLSGADVALLQANAIAEIVVARIEPNDIDEDAAAALLAARLAGAGLEALPPVHGRANLAASRPGLLLLEPDAVRRVNAVNDAVTLATLMPGARVAAGEIAATVKIIPYALRRTVLEDALLAARPLRVRPFETFSARLIHTRSDTMGDAAKAEARAERVTEARLAAVCGQLVHTDRCPHRVGPLAAAIADAREDLVLVSAASATSDSNDVVPAAMRAAGARVVRVGLPVDPGNLLVLARLGPMTLVGMPGCARSPKRNGIDLVLEHVAARIGLTAQTMADWGVGGLLADTDRPEPRAAARPAGCTGAIVLAAGRAARMGRQKLVEPLAGKPVVAHILDALAAAGLPPPIVVLGQDAEAVRSACGAREAQFVIADAAPEGLSQSLAAGIAAVPEAWTAVLVCLGDMPLLRPETLAGLAGAPEPASGLVVPVHDGRRGNPWRWSRRHFAALRTLAGDTGGKALAAGLEPLELAVDDPGVLIDVDTPDALAAVARALQSSSPG